MHLHYEEWLPAAAGLRNVVTAYWRVWGDPSQVPASAILPDGHVELVMNLGDAVGLSGPAFTGPQPPRVVVGPLSYTVQMKYESSVDTFGIRFHPARGAAYLRHPAAKLVDKIQPLDKVSRELDAAMAALFAPGTESDSENFRASLDESLLRHLAASAPPDMQVVAMVDRLSSPDVTPSVKEMARELGLSERQVQRRFLAAVGMAPKLFVRVLRFGRLWQAATMGPPETWATLAAAHGYADQAHMVREFRAFGVEPPSHFFTPEWYNNTDLSRVSGTAKDVRSVQDPANGRRL